MEAHGPKGVVYNKYKLLYQKDLQRVFNRVGDSIKKTLGGQRDEKEM